MSDAREIIYSELSEKVLGSKKVAGDSYMIVCPFHGDTDPSLGVNLTTDTEIPLGQFHCFAGETRVITSQGTKPIRELAGSTHNILTTGGQYVDAPFKSYGRQRLYKIVLTKDRREKIIYATKEHRWFLKGMQEETTETLRKGDRLETVLPEAKERFGTFDGSIAQMRWRVNTVSKTNRYEDVFCCEVPETHAFALEDHILTGNCFGCGTKGNWNALAEKLGLEQIKEWELGFTGNGTKRESRKRRAVQYLDPEQELKSAIFTNNAIKWPANQDWRGYPGSLIRKLGGICYDDPLTQDIMLFFPIRVNGIYKGGVRAYLEKQVDGNSYLTTKGKWAKSYGLLGYEYVKKIVRKYKYNAIVLVEGPRDELRLLYNYIPTLAVLGIEVISDKKIMRILAISKRIKTIYVMPDNDKAGTLLYKHVKHLASHLVEVKHLKLPKPKKNGKLVKIDPDSCDQKIIDEVRHLLNSHKEN